MSPLSEPRVSGICHDQIAHRRPRGGHWHRFQRPVQGLGVGGLVGFLPGGIYAAVLAHGTSLLIPEVGVVSGSIVFGLAGGALGALLGGLIGAAVWTTCYRKANQPRTQDSPGVQAHMATGLGLGGWLGGLLGGVAVALLAANSTVMFPGLVVVAGSIVGGLIGAGAGMMVGGVLGALGGFSLELGAGPASRCK